MNYSWLTALLIALTTSCQHSSGIRTNEGADLILTGAKIFTSDSQQPWAEAVAIKDGKFIFVGDEAGALEYRSANTRSANLQGRLVIPGMVDAHAHPGYIDVEDYGDISETSREAMLAAVKKYADDHPNDEYLRLCCWPVDMYVHGAMGPNKAELDAIVPDRPVWFASEAWHDRWLNSKALEVLGPTWGGFASIQVDLTECVLSDVAENAASFPYQLAGSDRRRGIRRFLRALQ